MAVRTESADPPPREQPFPQSVLLVVKPRCLLMQQMLCYASRLQQTNASACKHRHHLSSLRANLSLVLSRPRAVRVPHSPKVDVPEDDAADDQSKVLLFGVDVTGMPAGAVRNLCTTRNIRTTLASNARDASYTLELAPRNATHHVAYHTASTRTIFRKRPC